MTAGWFGSNNVSVGYTFATIEFDDCYSGPVKRGVDSNNSKR